MFQKGLLYKQGVENGVSTGGWYANQREPKELFLVEYLYD